MQIYEIKNDTAKILYDSNENIYPADFLYTEDTVSTVISQVTEISTTEDENVNCATTKFLLTVDKDSNISLYDGRMPQKNAQSGILNVADIVNLLKTDLNLINWGKYFRLHDINVETGINYLLDKPCVICDKQEQSIFLVKKIIKALNSSDKKVLVLDYDGKYKNLSDAEILTYGKDFKIPLNSKAFDYIFNTDLNDSPINSKITIQNIILELQKYAETTEGKFIPFEVFMNIIAAECQTNSDSGLLLFANKLAEYKQKKIFADSIEQFSVNFNSNLSILDVSDIDCKFHKLISQTLSLILPKNIQIISDVNDEIFDSTAIKNIYEKNNLNFIPIIEHECSLLNEIKTFGKNFVIFAPIETKFYSEPYGVFLEKLSFNDFILWGENTLYIPFIVSMEEEKTSKKLGKLNISKISAVSKPIEEKNSEIEEKIQIEEENINVVEKAEDEFEENDVLQDEEFVTQDDGEVLEEDIIAPEQDEFVYDEITEDDLDDLDNLNIKSNSEADNELYDKSDFSENEENLHYESVETPENYSDEKDFTEIKDEEDFSEQTEDFSEENQPEELENTEHIENVKNEEQNIEEIVNTQENIEKNPIQEEQVYDENYQQAYSDAQTKAQEQIAQNAKELARQQEQVKIKQRENLPVYEPKEPVTAANEIPVEGDRVMHAKYGAGTVEKIIRYGKKTLCSIQFDNVGRRLLDPNITTIEKM